MSQGEQPPKQPNQDATFTKTPKLRYRAWLKQIKSLAELKCVDVIIEETRGWHREWTPALPVEFFVEATGLDRTNVMAGLKRAMAHRIVERWRQSPRAPYQYRLVLRDLQAVKPAPPRAKQKPLPYTVEVFHRGGETQPLRGGETQPHKGGETQPHAPLAIDLLKKGRSKEHTHVPQNPQAVEKGVRGSRYTREQIRQYAWQSHNFTTAVNEFWRIRGRKDRLISGINNPNGWATAAFNSGAHDDEIAEWIRDPTIFDFDEYARQCRQAAGY